ncbi:hypothetical protein RB595_010098 [Gaeumannomyces hyphopodioides]
MVFYPPAWVPQLPFDPPDSISIEEFMTNEQYGRAPVSESMNPFTCGLTGKTYSNAEASRRTDHIARALGRRLGWRPREGTAWDKVVAVFSANAVDYRSVLHAVHRLDGIATPANAAYSVPELAHQLTASGAKALVTCAPLLDTALAAAQAAGIARDHVFVMWVPGAPAQQQELATVDDLADEGGRLPELERVVWPKGQGARQPAFLCFSSGTSGLPKAVMISHRNVIANVMQFTAHDSVAAKKRGRLDPQATLGLLPFSHIYALVIIVHSGTYRGDGIITLPKFELGSFLEAIQRFRISQLYVVPPIIIQITRNADKCKKYDLSSVRCLFSGAAPLGEETVANLRSIYPDWLVTQGYGMTETATVVCSTSEHDVVTRSSGSLVAMTKAKLMDEHGNEVTALDTPGELYVQSPSVTMGYLNNEKATAETFVHHDDGRWIRTGDEVLVTRSPAGHEHIVVLDRIKELIKVKGHQVAPAELEAHLLTHPFVEDCSVIQVPDDRAGEVPKAFVVRSAAARAEGDDAKVVRAVERHVEEHKAPYKWLKGGVEFVDEIPKSPSGKILRRLLRDREKEKRRVQGSKM